ncbi:MAG: hypothetical protein IPF68_14610 [Bacteroidales bacterium]|nr:hypothetical protein [Bacteroidales bacterium]
MKIYILLIVLLFVYPLMVTGQGGCKPGKPYNFNKIPFNTNDKLASDRFYHTLNPKITNNKHLQLETSVALRDEFYKGKDFNKSTSSTFNIYSGCKIKYAFTKNSEFNLIVSELILYSGDEIEEYGGENPYSRYSLGTKCVLYRSDNDKNIVGLWGQLAFSNKEQFNIYPELKILLFKELFQSINFTSNIGGAFITRNTVSITYSIELKFFLTKKLELIVENYTDYIHLNSIGKPANRLLSGFGIYVRENFYMYMTYEKGIVKSDYLNKGKIDLGLAFRF